MKKKYMVYYISSDGYREGNEYIWAIDKEEALELYRRYFNVATSQPCQAVGVYDKETGIENL